VSQKTTYYHPDGSVSFEKTLIVTDTNLEVRVQQLESENAALREDKDRLDWILTHEGASWLYWAAENGQWTPEVGAGRAAIDAARKRAQP
jgi:hypothetical protein